MNEYFASGCELYIYLSHLLLLFNLQIRQSKSNRTAILLGFLLYFMFFKVGHAWEKSIRERKQIFLYTSTAWILLAFSMTKSLSGFASLGIPYKLIQFSFFERCSIVTQFPRICFHFSDVGLFCYIYIWWQTVDLSWTFSCFNLITQQPITSDPVLRLWIFHIWYPKYFFLHRNLVCIILFSTCLEKV